MKQSQIVNYYLVLNEKADGLGLKIEPVYQKFRIMEGDDLNVVAGYLEATEHYTNKTQIAP